jgi:hypothetical protein
VGNPASSVQQVSSKWPANTCRSVLSTRHSCLGAYSTSMEGGLGARSCPARLLLTLKFQPKQTPLGWLALAGGNEEAAGRAQFWRDTHEIKSCVPPEVTRSSSPPALHTL